MLAPSRSTIGRKCTMPDRSAQSTPQQVWNVLDEVHDLDGLIAFLGHELHGCALIFQERPAFAVLRFPNRAVVEDDDLIRLHEILEPAMIAADVVDSANLTVRPLHRAER